jgi:hypothetical protein
MDDIVLRLRPQEMPESDMLAWFVAQRQAQVPSLDVFLDHCVPAFADRRCFATREADQAGGLTFLR